MNKIVSGKLKKLLFITSAFLLFSTVNAAAIKESISGKAVDDATIAAGKTIFEGKCQSCHAIDRKMVGPALKDVHKRRKFEWLVKWIGNNEALRKSGDKDAIEVWEKNNKAVMSNFADLKEDEMASLIMYIEDASAGGGAPIAVDPKAGNTPVVVDEKIVSRVNWSLILLFVLVAVILFMIIKILDQVSIIRGKDIIQWNNVNGIVCLVFMAMAFVACFWEFSIHGRMVLPEASTEHGRKIDQMFNITLFFTGIVFVITEFLLFYFAFKYRGREGRKAFHYSHNNKVEAIWTIIPAIVLTVLVIGGLKTWRGITNNPERGKFNIEIFAYQFGWTGRYPGEDGKLGKSNWNLISDNNPLGVALKDRAENLIPLLEQDIKDLEKLKKELPKKLALLKTTLGGLAGDERKTHLANIEEIESGTAASDLDIKIRNRTIQIGRIKVSLEEANAKEFYDNTGLDDIIVNNEIHVPVNKTVTFKLRARDVLHSAYIPMFRSQINVVPGLGTEIVFKAIETTKEKQAKLNRPDFDYWILCAKNCGAGHFSMKLKIVVDTEADYQKWINSQAAAFTSKPEAPAKEEVKKDSTIKG
ncbi:MAG: cytochrome c oxidase subunit II transmembrane domain-containing protein [Bacteroidia bacterium]